MTADELDRILKLAALAQQSALEIFAFINNMKAQGGKTTEEILTHADQTNAKAKEVIDSL